jgi:hypothetical protein
MLPTRHENTLRRANVLDPVFEFAQRHLQPARELARLRGRRHSLVQTSSNHALEIASRSMQRRLGYVEPACRRLERTAFRDCGESADMRVGDLVLHRLRRLAT